LHNKINRD